ncbi:hypothetical protein, partial [Corynebacterium casei]|uniref:hypothetical protein n=1 Tax=Corynebacterium casei TaxID=160386 RepID=UPI003FD475AA
LVCVVCVISYFFCENGISMLMLSSVGVGVCLVFFSYGCSPPLLVVIFWWLLVVGCVFVI